REATASPSKYDLTLSVVEAEGRIRGAFEYNTDLFDASTIDRLANHLLALLDGLCSDPDQPASRADLLSHAERQQLLEEWNRTAAPYRQASTINGLFEQQVRRSPQAVAVECSGQQISYGELNRRANQLAHYLRSKGVGEESLVGECVERTAEMLVGVL